MSFSGLEQWLNPELFNINDLKKTSQESLDSAIDAKVSFILTALAKRVKEESKKGKNKAYVYKIGKTVDEFGEDIKIVCHKPLFRKHYTKIHNSVFVNRLLDSLVAHGFTVEIEPLCEMFYKYSLGQEYAVAHIWVSW